MKRITLSLFVVAALAAGSVAKADHVTIRGSIGVGVPIYTPAPVYTPAPAYAPAPVYVAPRGYWREAPVSVWVPACRIVRYDRYGREFTQWEPGHYETRMQRIWVTAERDRHDHDRWEHNGWNR